MCRCGAGKQQRHEGRRAQRPLCASPDQLSDREQRKGRGKGSRIPAPGEEALGHLGDEHAEDGQRGSERNGKRLEQPLQGELIEQIARAGDEEPSFGVPEQRRKDRDPG